MAAEKMEDLLRRIQDLVKGDDDGSMYRGWSPDQEKLRREITEAGLYPEPYTRTAGISDEQNAYLLRKILELFGMVEENRGNGFKDIQAQQNSGNDPADVTKDVPGKYRTPYQAQISGKGFESLAHDIQALVLREARSLAAEMRKEEKALEEREREEKDRKAKEREEKERREKEEADKKEREEKERKDKDEADKKEREEKDNKIAELSAQVQSMMQQIQTMQSQTLSNPLGSRAMTGQPVPAANVPGILSPMNFNPADAQSARALSAFMDKGKTIMAQYDGENGDRAKLSRIRKELVDAQLAYKNGGSPQLNDPQLQVAAKELGLPYGIGIQQFNNASPAPGNGGVA